MLNGLRRPGFESTSDRISWDRCWDLPLYNAIVKTLPGADSPRMHPVK